MSIDLAELQSISLKRAKRWHTKDGISDWSALEQAGAMAGEAGEALGACADMAKACGEACNAAKKLKRLSLGMKTKNKAGRHYSNVLKAENAVAKEACDTILYAVLLLARVGYVDIDFERILSKVFNDKSIEYGFPERVRVFKSPTPRRKSA